MADLSFSESILYTLSLNQLNCTDLDTFGTEKFKVKFLIQRESQNVLGRLREQDFQHAFQLWQRRWDRCVTAQGDYFEGDAAQT
jgi:hypothetical protein